MATQLKHFRISKAMVSALWSLLRNSGEFTTVRFHNFIFEMITNSITFWRVTFDECDYRLCLKICHMEQATFLKLLTFDEFVSLSLLLSVCLTCLDACCWCLPRFRIKYKFANSKISQIEKQAATAAQTMGICRNVSYKCHMKWS